MGHSADGGPTMPSTLQSLGKTSAMIFQLHYSFASWARTEDGQLVVQQGSRVLESIMITRSGSGKVGFPGGFLKPGESVLNGSRRKFIEEALAYDSVGDI